MVLKLIISRHSTNRTIFKSGVLTQADFYAHSTELQVFEVKQLSAVKIELDVSLLSSCQRRWKV